MPDQCKSCQAPIRWVKTSNGKAMPLNAEPDPKGNIFVDEATNVAMVVRGFNLSQARAVGTKLYMPHHATCPQAAYYRKESKDAHTETA